jgi:hypothetical protein
MIVLVSGFLKSTAGNADTLTLTEYLRLFDHAFTPEFNLGWLPYGHKNADKLSFNNVKHLNSLKIRLSNGFIMSPEISGRAYSYLKLNEHLFWLVCCSEGVSGTSFLLYILDTKHKTVSKTYQLANAFGDQGDWAYTYGKFENDSTYTYLTVFGSEEGTQDSTLYRDRIKRNGEVFKLTRRKLK